MTDELSARALESELQTVASAHELRNNTLNRAAFRLGGKLRGPWPMIETPTLIVWGEEDAALGIELLDGTDAHVRDLTIKRLPGVSHWVQQEAPDKVNAILRDWLPRA